MANRPAQTACRATSYRLRRLNREHDKKDEYFSDRLADEVLNVLAMIHGLRVAARSSTFTFKGKPTTVAEVGRALNVDTLLEGSVRKAGSRMRISVQLVQVADGYHLWSESYDRTLEDIFASDLDLCRRIEGEAGALDLGMPIYRWIGIQCLPHKSARVRDNPQTTTPTESGRRCYLVETKGIEPSTSALRTRRSPS